VTDLAFVYQNQYSTLVSENLNCFLTNNAQLSPVIGIKKNLSKDVSTQKFKNYLFIVAPAGHLNRLLPIRSSKSNQPLPFPGKSYPRYDKLMPSADDCSIIHLLCIPKMNNRIARTFLTTGHHLSIRVNRQACYSSSMISIYFLFVLFTVP